MEYFRQCREHWRHLQWQDGEAGQRPQWRDHEGGHVPLGVVGNDVKLFQGARLSRIVEEEIEMNAVVICLRTGQFPILESSIKQKIFFASHLLSFFVNFAPSIKYVYEGMIEIGLKHTSKLTVTEELTAMKIGSGDMPVLATPVMMALMENAAMLAVKNKLPEGQTTVGGHIESSHLKPSKIGDVVSAEAEVTKVDGRKIEFRVSAYCDETLLGEGTHLRFIVDREKFMSRLG